MAEIVLITGKPGAGKTAHMVHLMLTDPIFKDAEGNPRKVFSNIKELQLPHIQVSSILSEQSASTEEKLSFHDCYQWIKQPENLGSILIIDEVQDVYPARSNGSKVPENVSWLNTHRHLGVDIFILTQDPKDIDSRVRNLVGKHYHIAKNKLGMRTLLEWKYCANNPLTQSKDALAKIHKIDEKVKDLYKSAEIHTQNENKRSKWVFILPIAVLMIPIMFFISYNLLKNMGKSTEEEAQTAASAPASLEQAAENTTAQLNNSAQVENTLGAKPEDFIPRLAERPETKPLYDSQRQVQTMEWPIGCIINVKNKCHCFTDQGTKIKEIHESLCRIYAVEGVPFNPYKRPEQQNQQKAENSESAEPGSSQVAQMGGKPLPSLREGDSDAMAVIQ